VIVAGMASFAHARCSLHPGCAVGALGLVGIPSGASVKDQCVKAATAESGELPAPTSRRVCGEALVACLIGLIVAVITTWPMALHLNTLARDSWDVPYEAWLLDWSGHVVSSGGSLLNANIFHPTPGASMGADPLWGLGIPLAPLRMTGLSALGVHNVALLLAFALNAGSGYVAGRVMSGSRSTGVVVAAAVSFGPFHTAESGHLQILFHPALALAAVLAWLIVDRLEHRRPLTRPALFLGTLLAWQLTVSLYVALFSVVVVVVVVSVRVIMARPLSLGPLLRAVPVAAALPVVTAVAIGAAYSRRSEPLPTLQEALHNVGALSGDFVHTQPKLVLWGNLLGEGDGWLSFGGAFPGLTLVVLGAIGIAVGWRSSNVLQRRVARTSAALVVVGLVLALGAAEGGPRSVFPWRWVITYIPALRGFRAMNRGMLVVLLGLGLAGGIALRWISSRARAVTPALLASLVVALIAFEGLASWADSPMLAPRRVDAQLAAIDEGGAVLYLPLPPGTAVTVADWGQAIVALRTTAHHRPTVNGYGGFFPASYLEAKDILGSRLDSKAERYLRDNDVRFVVVDRREVAGTSLEPLATGRSTVSWLSLIYEDENDLLYRVEGRATSP
jgi:hypothetical protein